MLYISDGSNPDFLNRTELEPNFKLFFRTRTEPNRNIFYRTEPNLESFYVELELKLNTFYHVHRTSPQIKSTKFDFPTVRDADSSVRIFFMLSSNFEPNRTLRVRFGSVRDSNSSTHHYFILIIMLI